MNLNNIGSQQLQIPRQLSRQLTRTSSMLSLYESEDYVFDKFGTPTVFVFNDDDGAKSDSDSFGCEPDLDEFNDTSFESGVANLTSNGSANSPFTSSTEQKQDGENHGQELPRRASHGKRSHSLRRQSSSRGRHHTRHDWKVKYKALQKENLRLKQTIYKPILNVDIFETDGLSENNIVNNVTAPSLTPTLTSTDVSTDDDHENEHNHADINRSDVHLNDKGNENKIKNKNGGKKNNVNAKRSNNYNLSGHGKLEARRGLASASITPRSAPDASFDIVQMPRGLETPTADVDAPK